MSNSKESGTPAVVFIQDGARLHYALPLALRQLGWLEKMVTDVLIRPHSLDAFLASLLSVSNSIGASRMSERRCAGIENLAKTYPLRSLWWRTKQRQFPEIEDYYEWLAAKTGAWLLKQNFGKANLVHGFIRNLDPKFCMESQKRGLRTVGDQMIAPAAVEAREMAAQRACWPGWSEHQESCNSRLVAVEEKTWTSLDHITCASDYVKSGLEVCGVAAHRISVLPYPSLLASAPTSISHEPSQAGKKLRVGFVGSVNLRKGAPVFLELAKRLSGENVEFVMVGPVAIPPDAVQKMTNRVQLIGPVPRSEVTRHLQSFDIFLFPSVCEGSAGVVMEALTAGLPVVTTPNSGTVVQHGVEGFVHEPDDLDGMEVSLRNLLEDGSLRQRFANAASSRSQEYGIDRYRQGIETLLPRLL